MNPNPLLSKPLSLTGIAPPQVNAELLPDIIVGGAEEEAALRRLETAIAAEADVIRHQIQSRDRADGGSAVEDDEAIYSMASAAVMSKRKCAIPQFNLSQQADIPLSRHVESAATLADAKVLLPSHSPCLVSAGSPNALPPPTPFIFRKPLQLQVFKLLEVSSLLHLVVATSEKATGNREESRRWLQKQTVEDGSKEWQRR